MTKPNRSTKATSAAAAANQPTNLRPDEELSQAADILFGTPEHPITLRNGTKVIVQAAQLKHLGILLALFSDIINGLDQAQIIEIVQMIETRSLVPVYGANGEEVPSVETTVGVVLARSNLLLTLATAAAATLPKAIEAMSSLNFEQAATLELDEGVLVSAAVFKLNYRFFSQSWPLIRKAMAGQLAKVAQK